MAEPRAPMQRVAGAGAAVPMVSRLVRLPWSAMPSQLADVTHSCGEDGIVRAIEVPRCPCERK